MALSATGLGDGDGLVVGEALETAPVELVLQFQPGGGTKLKLLPCFQPERPILWSGPSSLQRGLTVRFPPQFQFGGATKLNESPCFQPARPSRWSGGLQS